MSLDNNASLKEVLDTFELVNSRLIDRGGARTITPGTSNQVLAKGNYKGDITIKGDSNLKEENIKSGVTMFGVTGNVIAGKRFASGTATIGSSTYFTTEQGGSIYGAPIEVRGLGFKPSYVIAISTKTYVSSYTFRTISVLTPNLAFAGKGKLYDATDTSAKANWIKYTSLNCGISSDGFKMFIQHIGSGSPETYNWYAFE